MPVGDDGGGTGSRRMKWSSPLRVAQCRARCLQTFSDGPEKDAVCMQGPDCFMCWENCELLQYNYDIWSAMCTQKGICFPGCQQACRFHREALKRGASRQLEPVVYTVGHQVVQVEMLERTQGGGIPFPLVSWPSYNSTSKERNGSLVYVLMTRKKGTVSWTQVTQTVDLEARLLESPAVIVNLDIRVMVVDPKGLATIYSPAAIDGGHSEPQKDPKPSYPSTTSTTTTTSPSTSPSVAKDDSGAMRVNWPLVIREDVTSPLDDSQLALLFPTPSTEEQAAAAIALGQRYPSSPLGASLGTTSSDPWVLHEVSLIHQRVLVIAEVSWEVRRWARVYLVTWEVDGGGLKGNLFTHTTSVTLSLWPQTLYHIQVEVVSRLPGDPQPPDRSQVLHLNTRRAAPVVLAPDAHQQAPLPVQSDRAGQGRGAGLEVLAGTALALLVFFIFLAALSLWAAWRRRRPCSNPDKAALEDHGDGGDHGGLLQPRGYLFLLLRFLPEVLMAWTRRAEREERHRGVAPGGARIIPTVFGPQQPKAGNHERQWSPLHPESYADAILGEADRCARNEVQV